MNATTTEAGRLLLEYKEGDVEAYNDTRRGYHHPVEPHDGAFLFGPEGELEEPTRCTTNEWFLADWMRDQALDGDRRANESAQAPLTSVADLR